MEGTWQITQIDSTNKHIFNVAQNRNSGQYMLAIATDGTSHTGYNDGVNGGSQSFGMRCYVYKSSDYGSTWTYLDSSNVPNLDYAAFVSENSNHDAVTMMWCAISDDGKYQTFVQGGGKRQWYSTNYGSTTGTTSEQWICIGSQSWKWPWPYNAGSIGRYTQGANPTMVVSDGTATRWHNADMDVAGDNGTICNTRDTKYSSNGTLIEGLGSEFSMDVGSNISNSVYHIASGNIFKVNDNNSSLNGNSVTLINPSGWPIDTSEYGEHTLGGNIVVDISNEVLFCARYHNGSGGIWRSGDTGTNWTKKTGDINVNAIAMSSNAQHVIAGPMEDTNGSGTFYLSSDSGDTWTTHDISYSGFIYQLDITNDGKQAIASANQRPDRVNGHNRFYMEDGYFIFIAPLTAAEQYALGKTVANLLAMGYPNSDIVNAGYSITELIAGMTVVQLVDGGLTIQQLIAAGVSVADLVTGGISVADLVDGGVSVADLVAAGVSVADLVAGGVSVADLVAASVSVADLLAGGVSVADLLAASVSIADLFAGGVSIAELIAASVSIAELIAAGISTADLVAGGINPAELYKLGIVPDWTIDTDANHLAQSYVKDFIDISGSLALRENSSLTVNGNIETKGNITIKNPIMTADLSLNHNLFVGGDISINGNVTVSDVSMNGKVVNCSFTNGSIPEAAFVNITSPGYTQPTIIYEKGFDTFADVSMNANVQINNLKVDGNIEFSDGTTMNTYDPNIDYTNINQQYSILNKPVTNISHDWIAGTTGNNDYMFGTMKISSDGSIICVQIGVSGPNLTSSTVSYNYTGFGLLISRNGGKSWNLTKMSTASTGHIASDNSHLGFNMSRDGKHMICITSRILNKPDDHQYIWFSHDYGVTWTQGMISPAVHSERILLGSCISDDGVHMYVNSYQEYVHHQSHDSGSTWTSVWSQPGGRSAYYGSMLCSSNGQKLIYSTNGIHVGYSTDFGATFASLSLSGNSAGIVANEDFTKMILLTSTINILWQCDGDFTDINNWTLTTPFDATNTYGPKVGLVASPNYKHIMLHCEASTTKRTVSDDYGTTWSTVEFTDAGRINPFSMAISDTGKLFYLDSGGLHINMINLPNFKASTFTSLEITDTLTAGSFVVSSDYRIKSDISQLDEKVTLDNLRPVKYLQTLINKPQYGLIAHELQEYYPELVVGEKDGNEWQKVNYTGLIALLINEIKQLKHELTELENGM